MKRLFIYVISVFLACTYSCSKKELVSHYERPDWLKGNVWEVLDNRKEFTIFLKAVERAGFKEILNGKTIVSVFAPSDPVFLSYLKDRNLSSIDQIPIHELKKMIGYHLIYYSYDKNRLMNYQPQGSQNLQPAFAGLYYKHRSRSQDSISEEMDVTDGIVKKVYHKDRFVPVLSATHFQTKGIDAKQNYEYFFGADSWSGTTGFNVSNAGITEYDIPADNGYVYVIDQVIAPLPTVYERLDHSTAYKDFLAVYDRFRTYTYDEQASMNYAAAGESLFLVHHGALPAIASEWSYNGESGTPDYANLGDLSYKAFNVFAPNNQALSTFFNQYFKSYYPSMKEVDMLPLAMMLRNHVYAGNIVFPAEIGKNPDIKTVDGIPIVFNTQSDVGDKAIASNGTFYGLNKVLIPEAFNSVTGPVLVNPKYKIFLYMLHNSGMFKTLTSKDIRYTLLIPSDEEILSTLYGDSYIFWNEGNPFVFGDEEVQIQNNDGVKVAMSQRQQELFVSDHIVYDDITSLSAAKVYRTRNPYNYIFTKNGNLYSTATYNSNEPVSVLPLAGNWYNGKSYEVAQTVLGETRTIKFTLIGAETSSNPLNKYAEFSKLLAKAGMIDAGSSLSFLFGNRFMLFAPDNATVLSGLAAGLIPTEKTALAEYLKSYFVSVSDNSIGDYPFPGFGVQGTWNTTRRTGYNLYRQITLMDYGTGLSLEDSDGTHISIVDYLPQVFNDGAVYHINKLLKP